MSKIKQLFTVFSLLTLFSCHFFKNDEIRNFNTEFVEGSGDIPLAKGLSKINDESLTFDSLSGNVISISYKSEKDLKTIEDFYIKTLPQMGWKEVKQNHPESIKAIDFIRNNEKLEIEFTKEGSDQFVKFFAELGV